MHYWDLKYEMIKKRRKLLMWFVWKLPRPIIYWAVIRATANATTGKYGNTVPTGLGWDTILERWGDRGV